MGEELKITEPGAVVRATRVIRLPKPQGGVEIVVRVGAVPKLAIVQTLEGIPGIGGEAKAERGWEENKETMKASVKPEARLAELGIVEPPFSFEAREDGKAFWDDLLMPNQAFVIAEILEVSEWGKGAVPEGAKSFSGGAAGQ